MNRWFLKRLFIFIAAEILVLSAMMAGFVTKHLSGQAFGLIGLVNMVAFVILGSVLLRKWHMQGRILDPAAITNSSEQLRRLKRLRRMRMWILIRFCWVPIALILLAGEPMPSLAARITLYGFAILFMAFLFYRWKMIGKSIDQIQSILLQSKPGETL